MRNLRGNISADHIGRIIGVGRSSIYRWESGEVDPPLTKWIQYVKACGHDPAKEIQKIDIEPLDPSQIRD